MKEETYSCTVWFTPVYEKRNRDLDVDVGKRMRVVAKSLDEANILISEYAWSICPDDMYVAEIAFD